MGQIPLAGTTSWSIGGAATLPHIRQEVVDHPADLAATESAVARLGTDDGSTVRRLLGGRGQETDDGEGRATRGHPPAVAGCAAGLL